MQHNIHSLAKEIVRPTVTCGVTGMLIFSALGFLRKNHFQPAMPISSAKTGLIFGATAGAILGAGKVLKP